MTTKIIFIIPSITNSHYKNRILEFINNGFEVEVYGFERSTHNKYKDFPYKYLIIGNIDDGSYIGRINLYRKQFTEIGKRHCKDNVLFYLGGLDIAMFFALINPKAKYIYEECDLVHTYTKFKHVFEFIDKKIIKRSLLSVLTSEGFLSYHYGSNRPANVCLLENKLNPEILNCKLLEKSHQNKDNISIGFVGIPRFDSIYNFIDVFCKNFPQHTIHIFGGPIPEKFQKLSQYDNCHFHGFFNNPVDLPKIYSQIDLTLATYDVRFDNVRYAEPNKIYESMYFEVPIVVSKGTFLEEKVNRLGIGYAIDPFNEEEIINFIDSLSISSITEKKLYLKRIDKKDVISIDNKFYETLYSKLKDL